MWRSRAIANCSILLNITFNYFFHFFVETADLTAPISEILHSQPKSDLVKQESDKLDELKKSTIGLIIELQQVPDISKF